MKAITSETIKRHLEEKYHNTQSSMVAFEVADGTGGAASRWADAVSFEFWPSNGYTITGYEFKISRSDWLTELKQPEKSHAVSYYCDHWYLVAPKGVLGIDELPKEWGYIQVSDKSFRTKIKAPMRNAGNLDKCFVASLMRKCIEKYSDTSFREEMQKQAKVYAEESLKHSYECKIKRLERLNDEFKTVIDGFSRETGLSLSIYNYKELSQAVSTLRNRSKRSRLREDIERQIKAQKIIIENNEKSLITLELWPSILDLKED